MGLRRCVVCVRIDGLGKAAFLLEWSCKWLCSLFHVAKSGISWMGLWSSALSLSTASSLSNPTPPLIWRPIWCWSLRAANLPSEKALCAYFVRDFTSLRSCATNSIACASRDFDEFACCSACSSSERKVLITLSSCLRAFRASWSLSALSTSWALTSDNDANIFRSRLIEAFSCRCCVWSEMFWAEIVMCRI